MLCTKTTAKLACGLALLTGSSFALAQQRTDSPPVARPALDDIRTISTLVGTKVVNQANTTIAEIRDLALSTDGMAMYAILGHGGAAGVGEKYTAIPWHDLNIRCANGKWAANLNMTPEHLAKAPMFQSNNYRELSDLQWVTSIHNYFGSASGESPRTAPRPVELVLLASKIRGAKIYNSQKENLGKIEDLLLGRDQRVPFVIVGHGGVLGIGESYIPVPWSKLRLSNDRDSNAVTVMLNASKAQMEKAPLVKGNYSQMLAPGFADQVQRYFGAIGPNAG